MQQTTIGRAAGEYIGWCNGRSKKIRWYSSTVL